MIGVTRMLYMRSISGNDGSYRLSVSFDVGSDPEVNTVNVQNRVQRAHVPPTGRGAAERREGRRRRRPPSSRSSPCNRPRAPMTACSCRTTSPSTCRRRLARLPGVGQASPFGTQDYAMRIWLDLQRLTGFGLTAQDVINAVRAQNVQAAVGRIGGAPVIDAQQQIDALTTQGRLTTPEEFGNIIVRAGIGGIPGARKGRRPCGTRRAVLRCVRPLQWQGRGDARRSIWRQAAMRSPPPLPCAQR